MALPADVCTYLALVRMDPIRTALFFFRSLGPAKRGIVLREEAWVDGTRFSRYSIQWNKHYVRTNFRLAKCYTKIVLSLSAACSDVGLLAQLVRVYA